jgi:hypothetical protein
VIELKSTIDATKQENLITFNKHDEKIDNNKRDLQYKIRDVEDNVRTKITEHRVQDMMTALEKKNDERMKALEKKIIDRNLVQHKDLSTRFDSLRLTTEDQLRDLTSVSTLQESFNKLVARKDEFE